MLALSILAFALSLSPASVALAQGDPGPNTNLIGLTPDPADIRDTKARQQNEPSCAIRPGNSACIICGYNDYRTIDLFGDGWQGVSMSCDAGYNWVSRIAPGSPADLIAPINAVFAADPRMIAIPGMAIFNFIAGFRDSSEGVVAVQHWLEINKEDADHYEPGKVTYIVDTGTSGKFLDKPDMLAVLDPPNSQSEIRLFTEMENTDLGTIERLYPSGTLYAAFAAFTGNEGQNGNQSVKVLLKKSDDWGQTWPNQATKLSEDQNLVSGISLTAIGGTVLATWRRAGDNNDFDSIMYSFITQNGKKATKGKVLADICSFDQVSNASPLQVTFRTNDFPWAANDGKNFYIFYSDRDFGGTGDCTNGHPRIVMNHASATNKSWQSSPMAIDPNPTDEFGEANPDSFQFMPSAFGANGKVQLAWYDTRREIGLPEDLADVIDPSPKPAVIGDYVSVSGDIVQRKVDVFTTRVTSDASGNVQLIPAPVRVSQYRIATEIEDEELGGKIAIEAEASFANKKLYSSGSLPFLGDYITVAGQQYRLRNDGKWESNSSPIDSPSVDKADFFVGWTSNRDVRGNVLLLEDSLLFSPSAVELPQTTELERDPGSPDEPRELLAETGPEIPETGPPVDRPATAEGLDGSDLTVEVCTPGAAPLDRSRDSNIYGSVVKDQVRLYAPTATKPLSGLQRAFVVVLANTESIDKEFRLEIAQQPEPCLSSELCRASFRQQPSLPEFEQPPTGEEIQETLTVPAGSSFMRTVFVVADNDDAQVTVQAFDTSCPQCNAVASIILGGTADYLNPEYNSEACVETSGGDCDVLQDEFHNPALINPTLINPNLINPTLINPNLINPTLINPNLINPNLINYYLANPTLINPFLINPNLINYNLANPNLINPNLINPNLINPNLINDTLENPNLINPNLINPNLINPTLINTAPNDVPIVEDLTWTDYNYVIQNTGNVTTAYDADVTIENPEGVPIDTQLIAWAPSFTTTTVDCEQRLQVEANVFSTVNNPDPNPPLETASIENPFAGEISGLAKAGESLIFTLRVYADRDDLDSVRVSGFTTASQSANCTRDIPMDAPPDFDGEWFCYDTLGTDRELIVLDTLPPTLNLPLDSMQEAAGPDGAIVTYTVTATDAGDPNPMFECSPSSGTLFPLGATVVNCSATDAVGNTSFGSFTVTVSDNTPPTITAPTDVTFEATAADTPKGLVPLGSPTVFDAVGIASTSNDAPTSYPVGPTTVTWTVTDTAGLTATDAQLVTIVDTTPPTITAPPDVTKEATLVSTPVTPVEFGDATASDLVGVVSVTNDGLAGYPVGSTTVIWTATDAAGNVGTDMQEITITDTTPPVFNVMPGQTFEFEAATPAGAYVDLGSAVTATDKGVFIPVLCVLAGTSTALPATLPAGNYDVVCTANDGITIAVNVTIIVDVQDLVAPELSVPTSAVTADADPLTGTVDVSYTVTATDAVDENLDLVCNPSSGSTFSVGTTTVTCTATDDGPNADGLPNSTTKSFDVVVTDATAPTITVGSDPFVVNPGSAPVAVDFNGNLTVFDAVDSGIVPVCTPASGSLFDWGSTPVTCTATDSVGNIGEIIFDVLVDFPYDIDLIVPKGRAEAGSTVKIDWTYKLPGTPQVIDSSSFVVAVSWRQFMGNNCTGAPGNIEGADSGSSDFRYSAPDDSWRFNWQTPGTPGSYVVTVSPPRTNDGSNNDSSECVVLK